MPLQQIQQRGRIAGITFGSRRTERLPVLSGRLRVYRKQYQVRIFGQQADQRSPRLFQTDGNRPAAEALVQLHRPDLYGLRCVLHFPLFVPTGSRRCATSRNASGRPSRWPPTRPSPALRIAPSSNQASPFLSSAGGPGSLEKLIVESGDQTTSENSSRDPSASRCSKLFAKASRAGVDNS